ncbi:hypothetical protein EDC02_3070 [Micromonospora sp. Llam0]|uniref:hypothetical protein n=1 Tax=Micromonospora sp. Llam0 TaxID=2485143 RepID=UPI000F974C49|nr:hypothetical protein [Micromonospora sp. Llam0]ROO61141.1 hypothetical protein EDC02_3070 [Micromonospora sp. Llam0]
MSYPYGSEDAQYRPPATPTPTPTPTPAPAPAPAPPISGPPTQAFPAQPAYGPPPYPPTSPPYPPTSPPASGYPPPTGSPPAASPPTPPAAPNGRATVVLAVVSVLLLALGAVGFGLYFNERGELRETRSDLTSQLQEQRDIVTERDEKITETETRVGELTSELDTTKENLAGVTEERDVLLPCMRRAQEMFDAARAGDEDKLDTALRQADTACSRAQAGVDS